MSVNEDLVEIYAKNVNIALMLVFFFRFSMKLFRILTIFEGPRVCGSDFCFNGGTCILLKRIPVCLCQVINKFWKTNENDNLKV